jgi:hypothetical protein
MGNARLEIETGFYPPHLACRQPHLNEKLPDDELFFMLDLIPTFPDKALQRRFANFTTRK